MGKTVDKNMVDGVAEIVKLVKDIENREAIAKKMIIKFKKEGVSFDYNSFMKKCGCKGQKKVETKEMTGADSAGGVEAPVFGVQKRDIDEVTDASSSGAFSDVPFGGKNTKGGRRDPLKIDGVKSIKNSRAVKDKNFPKWGGPGGVFVTIKEKCKKFPYCNQGDMNAIELHEVENFKKTLDEVSKEIDIPVELVYESVIKEIKKIFM